jgi:hypothetical protein
MAVLAVVVQVQLVVMQPLQVVVMAVLALRLVLAVLL